MYNFVLSGIFRNMLGSYYFFFFFLSINSKLYSFIKIKSRKGANNNSEQECQENLWAKGKKENNRKENRREQRQVNSNSEQECRANLWAICKKENLRKENRRKQKQVNKNSEQECQANLCAKTGAHQTTM